ncbi:MAG: hypothetical protein COT74_06760 [Bdellovibrionales bacterium CG10_big_fil_rev_8_21_14_0_10_45_34]|nr:MAG: hypothetical protein COT74_06760 [Bdellovibrionales bacterium CG10_big_fil_rev_8_21_14_0_10_45_34]
MRNVLNKTSKDEEPMAPSKKPIAVALLVLAALLLSVVVDGSFLRFLQMRQESVRISESIESLKRQQLDLTERIRQAHRPEYIERQAVELFDVSQEDEIIFTFAGQNAKNQ